jgi:hypothetical protein
MGAKVGAFIAVLFRRFKNACSARVDIIERARVAKKSHGSHAAASINKIGRRDLEIPLKPVRSRESMTPPALPSSSPQTSFGSDWKNRRPATAGVPPPSENVRAAGPWYQGKPL